ncbi:hypothetical protein [Psychrobacillus vulpis]|nr:hypothetical protein [Psychrobacillus vulpis]
MSRKLVNLAYWKLLIDSMWFWRSHPDIKSGYTVIKAFIRL